jgi:two-component system nitrogen regulation sensor histidine kinase NtrY
MASEKPLPALVRRRVPLQRSRRRINFERRIWLSLWALCLPMLALAVVELLRFDVGMPMSLIFIACLLLAWALFCSMLMRNITQPIDTLANVVSALRMDDYSFRARGGRRNDSLGDLALEINHLANNLQRQRLGGLEAKALLDRVMSSMSAPVLAFDHEGALKLLNAAAEKAFHLQARTAHNRNIFELNLEALLSGAEHLSFAPDNRRWLVRTSHFRLMGIPHTLFVLSDISSALREEERAAWERLVRVLGHEINNSLAPIKSIAGSLRLRTEELEDDTGDFSRGLGIIESRAEMLNRFLQAYRQLMGLPTPDRKPVSVRRLVEDVAQLERRVPILVRQGEDFDVSVDAGQMHQALINLLRNGAEAALSVHASEPGRAQVTIAWRRAAGRAVISVLDNGTGLAKTDNLFVPFYTTKPEGSGIGLALAQQIIEGHRGRITLANRADGSRGCLALVDLPL